MKPKVTGFGGVGEIGGNQFLLEARDTRVLLDFGMSFSAGSDYFDSFITPRKVNGAGDYFEFGLLPQIPGLYSEDALQNTSIKHVAPEIDAVVLSHYHMDHVGRMGFVDDDIPVYCGETTALIDEAHLVMNDSPMKGHKVERFRTGDKFRIGTIEFVPVHVDHSIPGAYGFIIHTGEGSLVYSGDLRFHGRVGSMTQDFVKVAAEAKPDLLLSEGTRVRPGDQKADTSEEAVRQETEAVLKGSKKLVFSSFKGNDIDRVNSFHEAAEACGRRLVVSMKLAALLDSLAKDKKLKVPRVGKDVDVYLRRKRSGELEDKDYKKWERTYIDRGVSASDVARDQGGLFLHLETWAFPELIDIKPEAGGLYIHSATEAFNEEGERMDDLVRNWLGHLGFSYHQIHASGHAPMADIKRLVNAVKAKKVAPIHTEFPELFSEFRKGQEWSLGPPEKGVPFGLR